MRQAGFRSTIVLAATALAGAASPAANAPAPRPPAPAVHVAAPVRPPAAPASAAPAASAVPAASAASAPSAALSDACPAQLPVRQTIAASIDGWTPLNQDGSYPFVRVAFYPGPPAESSLIVPSVEYKGQAGLHDGWYLPKRPGGYWMTCAYANTTATLTRKLADDVDLCQADYDGRFLTLVVRHWSCGVRRLMAPPVWTHPAPRPAAKPPAKPPVKRAG